MLANLIVLSVIAVLFVIAVRNEIKKRRSGKCGCSCGGNCGACKKTGCRM